MRYPRSSYNDEALAKYSADCVELLKGGITSGRVFYLRGIVITNAHDSQTDEVVIYDSDSEGIEGATPGPAAADRRFSIMCGPLNTVVLDFGAPGIKFTEGVLAATLEDPAAGVFATNSISIYGFEE